uniref:Homeobox domain-containing protein n=1 Tax=Glossina brevipalpis TaxID=37001 RepID=A0A1A9WWV5_9MUSC
MSDFSIDYILNRAGERYVGTNGSLDLRQRLKLNNDLQPYAALNINVEFLKGAQIRKEEELNLSSFHHQIPMFDWLQYTRYHPPKLPKSMRQVGISRRTPGRLPRIPFTSAQLQALEMAYKKSTYLSAEEANHLADSLSLTNTRVKIWFQNRRARERREKREKEENYESTLSSNASSPEPEEKLC